jgi:hypothetical protein
VMEDKRILVARGYSDDPDAPISMSFCGGRDRPAETTMLMPAGRNIADSLAELRLDGIACEAIDDSSERPPRTING